jgi:hypothetical protein
MKDMDFETQLRSIASGMEYPPTPDVAGSVAARMRSTRSRIISRTLARSLVVVLVLLASLLFIPPVRAGVLDFIQVGIVRIFRAEPPTMTPVTATPKENQATPVPTSSSLLPFLDQIAGETTLQDAAQKTGYPILLPSYPAGIGEPDRVFLQDAEGPMTILVWMDPQQPGQVEMSLHFIPKGSWAVNKFAPVAIDDTSVNGAPAVWAEGPYLILLQNGDMKIERLMNGHVLIWENNGVTYRLETSASMEEAVRIAESLKPIP